VDDRCRSIADGDNLCHFEVDYEVLVFIRCQRSSFTKNSLSEPFIADLKGPDTPDQRRRSQ
jgi:hypothetical protein